MIVNVKNHCEKERAGRENARSGSFSLDFLPLFDQAKRGGLRGLEAGEGSLKVLNDCSMGLMLFNRFNGLFERFEGFELLFNMFNGFNQFNGFNRFNQFKLFNRFKTVQLDFF